MYMHRQGQAIALTPTESHTHALRVEPHMGWGSPLLDGAVSPVAMEQALLATVTL